MNYLNLVGGVGSSYAGPADKIMLAVIIVWSIVWKGLALWRAARDRSVWWFVIFMIVNTLGILEIVYLLFFSKAVMARRAAKKAAIGTGTGTGTGTEAETNIEK